MNEIELDEIMELNVVIKTYPNLGTKNQWRHRVYCRRSNGLLEAKVLIKRDRRWWIVLSHYRAWLTADL